MNDEILSRLLSDLSILKLPIDEVDIKIRPYSSTYYGRYFPVYNENRVKPKIHIYPYANKSGDLMQYSKILETGVHEICHHIQHTSGSFVRKRGIMHDTEFWKLYNHYIERATKLNMIGGEEKCEETI